MNCNENCIPSYTLRIPFLVFTCEHMAYKRQGGRGHVDNALLRQKKGLLIVVITLKSNPLVVAAVVACSVGDEHSGNT